MDGHPTVGSRGIPPSLLLLIIAAVSVLFDQVTKAAALAALTPGETTPVIDGVLHWTLQRNPGAAFSLFTNLPILFTVFASIVTVVILATARRVTDRFMGVSLGLILGGAVGNLIDRLVRSPAPFRGHVIDFIDFRIWPVFNLADSSIVVGAVLMVIASSRADKRAAAA